MKISRVKMAETLKNVFLLNELNHSHIELLLEKTELLFFPEGKMIYQEDSSASGLFIVYQGKVEVLLEKDYELIHLNNIGELFPFGEDVFLKNTIRRSSARATNDVILIKIDQKTIMHLLAEDQILQEKVDVLIASYELLLHKHIMKDADETIFYIGQSHPINVILKMVVMLLAIIGVGILIGFLFKEGFIRFNTLLWIAGVLSTTALLWLLWQYFEWSNDIFYFTDKKIMVRERFLLSAESMHATPLEAIELVQERRSFIGRNLNFGDLDIKTYTGSMRLPFVQRISVSQKILEFYSKQKRVLQDHENRQIFEKRVRDRIFKRTIGDDLAGEESITLDSQGNENPIHAAEENTSPEKENSIIYRTHWTILFSKVFIPISLLLSHIFLYIFMTVNRLQIADTEIFPWVFVINCSMLTIWAAYRFFDWRNDMYIITDKQLIDIDRKPLGREEKRTASINNIQSIRYKRKGIFGLLFNFGTVFIRIGDEEFSFDNVYRPSEVQELIFSIKERARQTAEDAQRENLQKKAVDWIDSYHNLINKEPEEENDDIHKE